MLLGLLVPLAAASDGAQSRFDVAAAERSGHPPPAAKTITSSMLPSEKGGVETTTTITTSPRPPEPNPSPAPAPTAPVGDQGKAQLVPSAGAEAEGSGLAGGQPVRGGRPVPAALLGRTGCRAICHAADGRASCGFRMQYAATTRYRGQAQACELGNVLVLLDCPDVCEGCHMDQSGCSQALAAGIASNVGSPYWVAEQEVLLERAAQQRQPAAQVGWPAEGPRGAAEPGAGRGFLVSLQSNMPHIVAGLSVVIIMAACGAQYAAKLLGWGVPAHRAAMASYTGAGQGPIGISLGHRGGGPGFGPYGNNFQYEGLADQDRYEGDRSPGGRAVDARSAGGRSRDGSPTSVAGTSCYG